MSLPEEAVERVALYFRALSDSTRLRIANVLCESDTTVGALAEYFGCSQANISKHLNILVEAGIVKRVPQGRMTHLKIADPNLCALCGLVCDSVAHNLEKDLTLHRALIAAKPLP